LRQQLSNYDKDKVTLQLTKQRLLHADKQLKNLEWEKEVLSQRFTKVEAERNELFAKFESSVQEVQQKTGLKKMLLEKKVEALNEALEKKRTQLAEVLVAANMDSGSLSNVRPIRLQLGRKNFSPQKRLAPWLHEVSKRHPASCACTLAWTSSLDPHWDCHLQVHKKLDDVLENKNQIIKALKYDVAKVSKAHNDLIRVYEAKLAVYGIPAEELGFRPLVTNTSPGPAGLVVGA
jgi:growth arrest-specific protein 8